MFPRRARLLRRDFAATTASAVRRTSENMTLLLPQQGRGYAVVVSKKVAPRATDRHKLKRRIVSALKTLSLPPALVVYPRLGARSRSTKNLTEELAKLLSQ